MILHQLRVAHWRNLLNPAEVGPFADGLNVIHAPNGTGKSSLFEAMRRTLFDAHQVSGGEIESVRPWGRSLAPQAMVEFSQAGVRYRIEKTFLDSASAKLFRHEAGQFAPFADGRNADAKLREILEAAEGPGRGLSKQEHWGLAQVLWAPQGSLQLVSLSPSVSENLRRALGVQLTGEGGSRLEQLLEEQYLALFTKGGKPRTGKEAAPILALESAHVEASKARLACLEKQRAFEAAGRDVEDARQRRAQARREGTAIREPLDQARRQTETYLALQAEHQQKRLAEQSAKERFEAMSRTSELIASARQDIANLMVRIQAESVKLGEATGETSAARSLAEERRRKRNEARQQRDSLSKRAAEVEDARAFLEETKSRQHLAKRLEQLRQLQSGHAIEKGRRAALVAPDEKTIREVRKGLAALEQARTTLERSLIRLTVRPRQSTLATPDSPEQSRTISAGEEVVFTGSPDVRLEIEGFGSIHATGPEVNVGELREEIAQTERKVARLTQPYGSQDPERLQHLRDQAKELDLKIEVLNAQVEKLLGADTLEDLQGQLARLEACIQERTGRFPAWKDQAPSFTDLQSALSRQRQAVESTIEAAEDAFEQAQLAAQGAQKRETEIEAELKNGRLNLEAANERLSGLTKDGLSDAARQAGRQEALMTWEAARRQAELCEIKLAEIGDDPRKALEKLERQFQAQASAEAEARDDEKRAEGRLQALAAEGAYSKLAACEEQLAELSTRKAREQLRMDALRLLHETVASCKAAAIAAVAGPVERTASRMLARIAGPRLGAVRLTEDLVPIGIQPEPLPEPVGLDNLSGGEQEQLFFITRLALGLVLAKEERQLVVLDDVLNATDTGRLARLLTVLEEAAGTLQIVILTCHPERYRGLEGARFFDLREKP